MVRSSWVTWTRGVSTHIQVKERARTPSEGMQFYSGVSVSYHLTISTTLRTFQATVEIPLDTTTSLLCYHGSPQSNEDVIISATPDEEMERMLYGYHAMVLAGGHTHTQMIRYHGDSTIINPGSIGAPIPAHDRIRRVPRRPLSNLHDREYPPWAEYGVIAWENRSLRIELRRVPIDIDLLVKKTHESGMPHADWVVDFTVWRFCQMRITEGIWEGAALSQFDH